MKFKENTITNKKVVHIYLTKEERADKETQKKIEQMKCDNKQVVLFVSGENDAKVVLKQMVTLMQDDNY